MMIESSIKKVIFIISDHSLLHGEIEEQAVALCGVGFAIIFLYITKENHGNTIQIIK